MNICDEFSTFFENQYSHPVSSATNAFLSPLAEENPSPPAEPYDTMELARKESTAIGSALQTFSSALLMGQTPAAVGRRSSFQYEDGFDMPRLIDDLESDAKTKNTPGSDDFLKLGFADIETNEESSMLQVIQSYRPSISSLDTYIPSLLDNSCSDNEYHLLSHYMQVVSRALVVVHDDSNPFLRLLFPMALSQSTVRTCDCGFGGFTSVESVSEI